MFIFERRKISTKSPLKLFPPLLLGNSPEESSLEDSQAASPFHQVLILCQRVLFIYFYSICFQHFPDCRADAWLGNTTSENDMNVVSDSKMNVNQHCEMAARRTNMIWDAIEEAS